MLNGHLRGPVSRSDMRKAVAFWLSRFKRVPEAERFRSPAQHDLKDDAGGLWFPADAVAKVEDGALYATVYTNVILFNGPEMRAFVPVWNAIVKELGLDRVPPDATADQKRAALLLTANPVSQQEDSIHQAIEKLALVERMLGGGRKFPWVTATAVSLSLIGSVALGLRGRG